MTTAADTKECWICGKKISPKNIYFMHRDENTLVFTCSDCHDKH